MAELILASASPRRRDLLGRLRVPFRVVPSDVPELPRADEAAADFALRVAVEKAAAVVRRHPRAWVLGADTVVVVDAAILGKPRDTGDARRMLRALSGRSHEVLTAVALLSSAAPADTRVVRTNVRFRDLSEAEIEAYVATGEPLGKAGAYAIQGGAARFVECVDGSCTNVVGLPLEEVSALLRAHGIIP